MPWVSFKDRKPVEKEYEEDKYLITRAPGYRKKGECFENWYIWTNDYLNIGYEDGTGYISHWWDGPSDMALAIREWKAKQDSSEASLT